MKKLLLLVGIASFSFAAAQDNGLPKVKVVPAKPKNNISSVPKTYQFTPKTQLLAEAKPLTTLPNGNKIYALPQDNMPCVVPDVLQYNMPVVMPEVPYTIPNPAYPQDTKPMTFTFTEEQLKQLLEKAKKNK